MPFRCIAIDDEISNLIGIADNVRRDTSLDEISHILLVCNERIKTFHATKRTDKIFNQCITVDEIQNNINKHCIFYFEYSAAKGDEYYWDALKGVCECIKTVDVLIIDGYLKGEITKQSKTIPNDAWNLRGELIKVLNWKNTPILFTARAEINTNTRRRIQMMNAAGVEEIVFDVVFKQTMGAEDRLVQKIKDAFFNYEIYTRNISLLISKLFNSPIGENIGHGLSKNNIPDIDSLRKFVQTLAQQCSPLMSESLQLASMKKQFDAVCNFANGINEIDKDVEKACNSLWRPVIDGLKDNTWDDPLTGVPEDVQKHLALYTSNSSADDAEEICTFEDWRTVYFKMRFWKSESYYLGGNLVSRGWLYALHKLMQDQLSSNGIDVIMIDPEDQQKVEVFLPKVWMAHLFDYLSSPSQRSFPSKLIHANVKKIWISVQRVNETTQDDEQPYLAILKISSPLSFTPNGNQVPSALAYLAMNAHLRSMYRLLVATRNDTSVLTIQEVVAHEGGHQIIKANNPPVSAENILIDDDAKSGFAMLFSTLEPI